MDFNKRLTDDMKKLMLQKQEHKDNKITCIYLNANLAVISVLKGKLLTASKEAKRDLTIAETHKIVKKEKEDNDLSWEGAVKGKREDIETECSVKNVLLDTYITDLEKFMPKQLSREEIKAEVQSFAAGLGRTEFTKRDMGLFMAELGARFAGRVDKKLLSQAVGEFLK